MDVASYAALTLLPTYDLNSATFSEKLQISSRT